MADDKHEIMHAERIITHDRVPGHDNYYEKDGLRTYGDGEDHGEQVSGNEYETMLIFDRT